MVYKHSIEFEKNKNKYILKISEPAPKTEDRLKPFLFSVAIGFDSFEDALNSWNNFVFEQTRIDSEIGCESKFEQIA